MAGKGPSIEYENINRLNDQRVQNMIDENAARGSKPGQAGKADWVPLVAALIVIAIVATILIVK